ncbi:hypothetical protein D7X33_19310 [Butyricicoccus sp. 1XD8-22]|nr:hypothetical protein D7X33_19310 [Butyricicoccus sp. 1XD8-22]
MRFLTGGLSRPAAGRKKLKKFVKKVLTNGWGSGIINKLTGTEENKKVPKRGWKASDEAIKVDEKLHLVN